MVDNSFLKNICFNELGILIHSGHTDPHRPFKGRRNITGKQLGRAKGIKQVHSWLKTKLKLVVVFVCPISWADTEEDNFSLNNHPAVEEPSQQTSSSV